MAGFILAAGKLMFAPAWGPGKAIRNPESNAIPETETPSDPTVTHPPPALPPAYHPQQQALLSADGSQHRDLEILSGMLMSYRNVMKDQARPIGINEDLTEVLTRPYRRGLRFLPMEHPAINEQGQLIDRWGTPIHLHPVSQGMMELRSAGPDRLLFTDDDIVEPR